MEKVIPAFPLASLFSIELCYFTNGDKKVDSRTDCPKATCPWSLLVWPNSYLAFHGFSLPSLKTAITILSVDCNADGKDFGRCWMYVSFCLLLVKFSCKKICFYGILMNKNHQSSLECIYFCKVLCKYHFYYELMSYIQRKSLFLVY